MSSKQYSHRTDHELLQYFYADGNNEWLGVLLKRYTLLLLGVCMKYLKDEELAKDAVQQIFLKTISELQKYKVDYFKSWLYTVARNHCLMQLRGKPITVPVEQTTQLAEDAMDVNEVILHDKQLDFLAKAMEELNEEQKTCVTLFYLQKRSYQEISDFTGYSLMQVKSHIQNGKRNLKLIVMKMQAQHG